MTNSAIYKGWVNHQRTKPHPHGFKYKVFMMYLDLDELAGIFNGFKYWSSETKNLAWFNFARFNRADYYGDPEKPLKEEISRLVQQKTGHAPRGKICLLTNMRYFGHCFNPVSFYYCFEADGTSLQAIVSHITNTPWGEKFAYVHDFNAEKITKNTSSGALHVFKFNKNFHVSPFMPMDINYDWAFKVDEISSPNQLFIHMKNLQKGQPIFTATMALERYEISEKALNRLLISHPLMTLKVVAAIYWNALLLWLKRIPFHTHE